MRKIYVKTATSCYLAIASFDRSVKKRCVSPQNATLILNAPVVTFKLSY